MLGPLRVRAGRHSRAPQAGALSRQRGYVLYPVPLVPSAAAGYSITTPAGNELSRCRISGVMATRYRCRIAALMLVAPLASAVVEHGSPGGCVAQLDRVNSNYWDNTVLGQPTESFSITVKITSRWPPFAHIKLTWVAPVEIKHVYGAEACTKGCPNLIFVPTDDAATMLTAQLGPQKHENMAITIAGTGSRVPPTVVCLTESEWSKAPPPAPPHASDCVLKPEYNIRNSWDAGESVEITFGAWEESGHLLRLYYWGQTSLQIEQPVHASIRSSAPHNQGYLVELKLGESCHITAVGPNAHASGTDSGTDRGENGPARNCVPETVDPSQQRMVSFQIKPPALHTPHITCHDPWTPPPPPPQPPSPPPKPSPPPLRPSPPPPPMSVASDSHCSLGGEAVVDGTQRCVPNSGGCVLEDLTVVEGTELRHVHVTMNHWTPGYIVDIEVGGYEIEVPHIKQGALPTRLLTAAFSPYQPRAPPAMRRRSNDARAGGPRKRPPSVYAR